MVLFSQNQKSGSLTAGDLNQNRAFVNEHYLKKDTIQENPDLPVHITCPEYRKIGAKITILQQSEVIFSEYIFGSIDCGEK